MDKDLQLAAALADVSHLVSFEGHDVIKASIEIPNAAGGLRSAMAIEPRQFAHQEKVFVVLECDVTKVRFDPIKETDCLARVHVLSAENATFVSGDLVHQQLAAQAERVEAARNLAKLQREKEEGTERLVGADGDDTQVNPDAVASTPAKKTSTVKGNVTEVSFGTAKPLTSSELADAAEAIRKLSKDEMRTLCDTHGIEYVSRTKGQEFVDLLAGVPGIAAAADDVRSARPPKS